MITITVTMGNEKRELDIGTTVAEALDAFGLHEETTGGYQDNPFVCAQVNCIPQGMNSPLTSDCTLKAVRLFSDIGKRCYRQSICFLLTAAAAELYPNRRLVIGYALGDGYYFTFADKYLVSGDTLKALREKMQEMIHQALPIEERILPYAKALEYFQSHHVEQTADLLLAANDPVVTLYELGDYLDTSYEPIVQNTHLLSLWELRPAKGNGLLLRYPRSFDFTALDTYKDNALLFRALQQNQENSPTINVHSIGELSRLTEQGKTTQFIRLCEEAQAKKIADIANDIAEKDAIRFVMIAGPSSSGKTTFAYKLCTQLQVRGKETVKLSLDNYYLPHDQIPKDKDGKPDLECIESLNLPMLQANLVDLADGKSVKLPTYDFATQTTTYGDAMTLDDNAVLVIEGIHGMNPMLTGPLDSEMLFRIYISAFTQVNIDEHNRISTTDNRIIRRIVRDHRTRGASAQRTLEMFPSVQRGENLYIFPYQNNADVMLNSALDYELAVLAPFAEPLLRMVKPSEEQTYVTARRLINFLSHFQPISDSLVPQDSLLREFVGGSEYDVR